MYENTGTTSQEDTSQGQFKESVCIDAYRVYDSCSDKDCLEDLRVYFCPEEQSMVDKSSSIRMRSADVITVYIDLEPVPFHKGFYSIDMTFFFEVKVDVFSAPAVPPATLCGLSIFSKKVVLYGSEGNVKVFSSDLTIDDLDCQNIPIKNLPKATVQVAEPIGLSARISDSKPCRPPCCRIPEAICHRFGGNFCINETAKVVYATIGLFTIVQIERNVQMLIPAYDFCIPEKECVTSSDNPCELFSRIDFPTNEFFPPKVTDISNDDRNYCRCKH